MYNRAPLATRHLGALAVGALLLQWPCATAASSRGARPTIGTFSSSTDAQTSEYDVKAAYIFNLLPFTTWPPPAFSTPAAPLTICVAEPDPFGTALKEAFQNEHVGDHPVIVTHVASPAALSGCHVLFIGSSADADGTLQQAAARAPVLTIGEARRFQERGGMVTFVIELGRVRFDVNRTSVTRANIQLSSKVLQIARNVS